MEDVDDVRRERSEREKVAGGWKREWCRRRAMSSGCGGGA